VWRVVLEETDRVGKVRLEAAESCLDKIGNECKLMKTDRASCFKMVCSRRTVFFPISMDPVHNPYVLPSNQPYMACVLIIRRYNPAVCVCKIVLST